LNGIEVARRLRKLVPHGKILLLTQISSPDVVREALSVGALGYVHKPHARSDLLPAIEAVLAGRRFLSRGLEVSEDSEAHASQRHEIQFCSDAAAVVDGLSRFIAAALNAGNAAIVWATESHRNSLLEKLRALGVDIDAAIQRGTYIPADADEPPDLARINEIIRGLSEAASRGGKKHPRVAVCGERAGRFWAQGKVDAAIQLERLLNELGKHNDVDILCPYPIPRANGQEDDVLKSICAEHTAVLRA